MKGMAGSTDSSKRMDSEDWIRPETLADFVGQPKLRERLGVAIQAARARNETIDHVLFSGPPGLGKTTLASILAREMGGRFHSTSAPALTKPGDLARILTLLEEGDILFIDEIHRLQRSCEEVLYSAMEDGSIDFILGEGMSARSVKLHLKPFTLVGATTRSGMLSAPLRARFGLHLKLDFYDEESLATIVLRAARIYELNISRPAATLLASRSRMTPRESLRLLRRVRDYATLASLKSIEPDFVEECMRSLGIDSLGLNETDRQILQLIARRYQGGPVGLRTIAALMDEEERTIEENHEPFLLRIGLIEKTPQGRILSASGRRYLGLDPIGAT
jgi:Holliday junction DNA helicase RuvB